MHLSHSVTTQLTRLSLQPPFFLPIFGPTAFLIVIIFSLPFCLPPPHSFREQPSFRLRCADADLVIKASDFMQTAHINLRTPRYPRLPTRKYFHALLQESPVPRRTVRSHSFPWFLFSGVLKAKTMPLHLEQVYPMQQKMPSPNETQNEKVSYPFNIRSRGTELEACVCLCILISHSCTSTVFSTPHSVQGHYSAYSAQKGSWPSTAHHLIPLVGGCRRVSADLD